MTTSPGSDDIPPLDPEQARMQRVLKVVVVGLGLLILFVLGIIIVTVVGGTDRPADRAAQSDVDAVQAPASMTGSMPAGVDFGSRIVSLPEGAEVDHMAIGDGVLALHVKVPGKVQRVILVNLDTGAVGGEINLTE